MQDELGELLAIRSWPLVGHQGTHKRLLCMQGCCILRVGLHWHLGRLQEHDLSPLLSFSVWLGKICQSCPSQHLQWYGAAVLWCALLAVVMVLVPITQMGRPVPAGYGHLVVATSTQCCIYSLSSLNTPTIVDVQDTVTLLLLSERQGRAALHWQCVAAHRNASWQFPQGAGWPVSRQQLRAQQGPLMQQRCAAGASS